jgi:hypothetical protein
VAQLGHLALMLVAHPIFSVADGFAQSFADHVREKLPFGQDVLFDDAVEPSVAYDRLRAVRTTSASSGKAEYVTVIAASYARPTFRFALLAHVLSQRRSTAAHLRFAAAMSAGGSNSTTVYREPHCGHLKRLSRRDSGRLARASTLAFPCPILFGKHCAAASNTQKLSRRCKQRSIPGST